MLEHHLAEERLKFLSGLLEVELARGHVEQGPVTVLVQPQLGVDHQRHARWYAADTTNEATLAGVEAVLQVLYQRAGVERRLAGPDRE